jgi:hypothetical protein
MKNIQFIKTNLLLFLSVILSASCNKNKNTDTEVKSREETIISALAPGVIDEFGNWPEDYIGIMANFSFPTINPDDGAQFKTVGKFMLESGERANIGPILLGGNQIQADADNNYKLSYDGANLSNGLNLLGTDVNVDFGDDSGPVSFRRVNVYIPKAIYVNNLNFRNSSINKNQNLPITWNADPNNMFGRVVLQVMYNPGLYSTTSSPARSLPIKSLQYTVSDNGSFTIPSADLQRFPVGSFVSIYIGRASVYSNVAYSAFSARRTVTYIAITESGSFPLKIMTE